MKKINVKGKLEGKFIFDNIARIYDKKHCCPTINTYGGGGLQTKVIREWKSVLSKQQNKDISN